MREGTGWRPPATKFKTELTIKIYRPLTTNVPSSFARACESGREDGMNQILFMIGDWPVRAGDALIGFGGLVLILLLAIVIVVARSGRHGAEFASLQAMRADEFEERLNDMLRAQSEANGRVDAMAQALAGRQAEMA